MGSTRTCTVAGVIPEDGEMVTPVGLLPLIVKSVLPPPGSVIVRLWVITVRLQKLPLTTTSRLRGGQAVDTGSGCRPAAP